MDGSRWLQALVDDAQLRERPSPASTSHPGSRRPAIGAGGGVVGLRRRFQDRNGRTFRLPLLRDERLSHPGGGVRRLARLQGAPRVQSRLPLRRCCLSERLHDGGCERFDRHPRGGELPGLRSDRVPRRMFRFQRDRQCGNERWAGRLLGLQRARRLHRGRGVRRDQRRHLCHRHRQAHQLRCRVDRDV